MLSVKSPCRAAIEVLGSSPTWQRKKEKEKMKNKNPRQQEPWRKLWKESPCLEVRTSRSTHFMPYWLNEFSLLKQWQCSFSAGSPSCSIQTTRGVGIRRPWVAWKSRKTSSSFLSTCFETQIHAQPPCVLDYTHTPHIQIQNLQCRRTILRNTVQAKKKKKKDHEA